VHGEAAALGVQHEAVFFFGARDALEHQDESAARAADVDRLIGSVENQDGHLQDLAGVRPALALRMHNTSGFCERLLLAGVDHGFTKRHRNLLVKVGRQRVVVGGWNLSRSVVSDCACAQGWFMWGGAMPWRTMARSTVALRRRQKEYPVRRRDGFAL
jgi:hypothetical protein